MATSPSVTVMFLCKSVATDLETEKKSISYFFEKDLHKLKCIFSSFLFQVNTVFLAEEL